MGAHVRSGETDSRREMDITEVPAGPEHKGRKKNNKKPRKKSASAAGSGEGAEAKEEKMERSEPGGAAFPPGFSVSEIKNKQRRHHMFMKLKQEKRQVRTGEYTNYS